MGDYGWQIDDGNEISEQEQKIEKVLYLSERLLETLREVVSIYSKFGDREAFSTFESRVSEIMKTASYESFFNYKNYEENSGKS